MFHTSFSFHAIQLIVPHPNVLQHNLARPSSQWTCSCLLCLVSSHQDLNTQRSLSSLAEQLCRPRCRLVATATFRSDVCGLRLSCTHEPISAFGHCPLPEFLLFSGGSIVAASSRFGGQGKDRSCLFDRNCTPSICFRISGGPLELAFLFAEEGLRA